MPRVALLLFLAPVLFQECCLYRIQRAEFEQLPLHQKVDTYEQAVRRACIRQEQLWMLMTIAEGGYEAADLMLKHWLRPEESFLSEDVITVLKHVHLNGFDLRQHEALRELERIAASSRGPALRAKAQKAVELIKTESHRR